MYYVYVLVNEEGKSYTGYTSNLRERVKSHKKKKSIYTGKYNNWELCYYEAYLNKEDALNREKALKKSGQGRRWLKERIKNSIETCRKN